MKKFLVILFLVLKSLNLAASPLEIDEAWNKVSDPLIMRSDFVYLFSYLPLSGRITDGKKYWSGDYWPLRDGNINYRWNARVKTGFDLKSPTRDELLRMPPRDISELSPSEKYDLLRGRYDYPLKAEVAKLANKDALIWEGICHGWAPATINHNEPLPKTLRNPDGVEIPFGSADIKGLLSYYYAHGFNVATTHQMGLRCFQDNASTTTQCNNDLNAGAFHIVLANMIGLQNRGFIGDMESTSQVWNHPIQSYASTVVGYARPAVRSAYGTEVVVRLKTTVWFSTEVASTWEATNGTLNQRFRSRDFEYDLELNTYGDIIGGEWVSKDRPDFLWLKAKPEAYAGMFSDLARLLDD